MARAGLPACLHPPRQKIVDLDRREIGLDVQSFVSGVVADMAHDLDRNIAGHCRAEIHPQPAPSRLIDRRLHVQFGVRIVFLLADIDCRWRAVDLDVAFDLKAVFCRIRLEQRGFDFLAQQHLFSGEIHEVGVDRIGRIVLGRGSAEQHIDPDLRGHRATGRCRIERDADGVA